MFRSRALALVAGLVVGVLMVGCNQKMADQPKYTPLQPSSFFADGMSSRPVLADTVARGRLTDDTLLETGTVNGRDAEVFPFPITRDVLERGQQRFDIYCVPCHGLAGYANGMVVQRGFTPPPSFHIDRLRQAPVGRFFHVITDGFGAMPSYAAQIPVRDRWAIIAYVRALQLSQYASIDDVPQAEREKLEAGGQP